MIIKIDYRETQLLEMINNLKNNDNSYDNINIASENLSIGDIIITDSNNNEVAIIERKTLNDLASSICDGRYNEQGFRLTNSEIPNHYIYYLIEGDITKYTGNRFSKRQITNKTLLSAITSISYFKGFSLYKSINIYESALWILQFTEKLRKSKETGYYFKKKDVGDVDKSVISGEKFEEEKFEENNEYTKVSKRAKKNNITQDNIGAIMLSQIPGVSYVSAIAIMREYKTIGNLIKTLEKDHLALNTITVSNRKLSKTCITNIFHYLKKDEIIVCDT
jgi:crossover junction endonuclease MUS81